MAEATQVAITLDDIPIQELGSIVIRVVVLPVKQKKDDAENKSAPVDLEPGEMVLDSGGSPLGSYLESSKGKRCCVFLVNGQRQDFLDNTFIYQDLGFKYLRNRMMIIIDVDGLTPEAIGRLMQSSRQGFYRGAIWTAIMRRITGTLKNDPDLLRLEEEAEEQVSELKAGAEKVQQTLDQLIEAHHDMSSHVTVGAGSSGTSDSDESLGLKTVMTGNVVSLVAPDRGVSANYPVLTSRLLNVRLRPDQARGIAINAMPSNAWPALASIVVDLDNSVPELEVSLERLADHAKLAMTFREPKGFDANQYPVRAKVRVNATFNGIKEKRQIELGILIKPDKPPPEAVLLNDPTTLKVSSREPVKILRGAIDTHVRLRWDGKDSLLGGPNPTWKLSARLATQNRPQPVMNFTEPTAGRFSLLISPGPDWRAAEHFSFAVMAEGPKGQRLRTSFIAEVVDPIAKPEPPSPRLVESEMKGGASRRPPYVLKVIGRDEYETPTCWASTQWTDGDPGCFNEPTARTPLTLIINEDMEALRQYRQYLTRTFTESEIERRINKYTSHVAFHLYQMYQATIDTKQQKVDLDQADALRRDEIKRVSTTLIKLMEVSR